jgi:hypothetical protein
VQFLTCTVTYPFLQIWKITGEVLPAFLDRIILWTVGMIGVNVRLLIENFHFSENVTQEVWYLFIVVCYLMVGRNMVFNLIIQEVTEFSSPTS